MWNIKKITILLCFLSLVAFISCSAEDKTGSPKPEGETEITGETGGGSGSGSGTGESGGSGETGGGSGTGESGSGGSGGGETGETKITIPEKYHGEYTTRGWSSHNNDIKISADKIVLTLDKKLSKSEVYPGTHNAADATVKKNTDVDIEKIKNGDSATVYIFKLKNNEDLYFIFYDKKNSNGEHVAFLYPIDIIMAFR